MLVTGCVGTNRVARQAMLSVLDQFEHAPAKGPAEAPMPDRPLPGVGTNWHTLQMNCTNNQITVFYDGTQMISATDTEATPYLTGGISADLWTDATGYSMWVDNVVVNSLTGGNGPLLAGRPEFPVQGPSAPFIVSLVRTNDKAVLSWTSQAGVKYQLLYKDDLRDKNWQPDPTILLAPGPLTSGTNTAGTRPQRFYKVEVVP